MSFVSVLCLIHYWLIFITIFTFFCSQILKVLKLVRIFIDENPLSCCYDEISEIKKDLLSEGDEIKLRQKNSTVSLRVCLGKYYLRTKIRVPDDYPIISVR